MTRRHTKKHPKRTLGKRTRKIIGTVVNVTAQQITLLQGAKGLWIFRRTSATKVISGTLRRGSTVTVEFNRQDGKKLGGRRPGKRTEAGTVIKLAATQITLGSITPDLGLWIIKRTSSTVITGTLSEGSIVIVESDKEDWRKVA